MFVVINALIKSVNVEILHLEILIIRIVAFQGIQIVNIKVCF